MPFTSGVFANVAGATSAVAGQVIQSATWDAIHEDYGTAFNILADQISNTDSYRNILWMNGGLEVWQRGAGASASIAVSASTVAYTADRWYLATDTNEASVVSAQTGLNAGSALAARVQRNSGETGTGVMRFAYPLDSDEIARLRGKFARVRFSIRAGANWSPASGTISFVLYVGTGAVAKRNATPYTGETSAVSSSSNLTAGGASTNVSAFSASVIPATSTQAELQFSWTPVGTAGTNDWFEIDDVQIEPIAASDTDDYIPDEYERLPFDVMLAGCKRYYQKSIAYNTAPASGAGLDNVFMSMAQAAELISFYWQFPVEMRSAPTFTKFSPVTATSSNWYNFTTSASISAAFATSGLSGNTKGIMIISSVSVSAIGQIATIHCQADSGI